MRRIIKAMLPLALLPTLFLAGCGPGAGADNPMWGNMVGTGLGMATQPTYQPYHPWQARCSTWAGMTTCTGN
jgi:hypothetical protein